MVSLLLKRPVWINRIACVSVLLLFVGAVHASQHWHSNDCADDVCAACLFTDSGSAVRNTPSHAGQDLSGSLSNAPIRSFVATSRPFEPRRTRAPPTS